MPKLYRRTSDGGYYTKSSVGEDRHTTLQVHPEGVRYLYQHGVAEGEEIGKRYMSHLWRNRWVSTSGLHSVERGSQQAAYRSTYTPSAKERSVSRERANAHNAPIPTQTHLWQTQPNKPTFDEWEQQVREEIFDERIGKRRSSSAERMKPYPVSEPIDHWPSNIPPEIYPSETRRSWDLFEVFIAVIILTVVVLWIFM